MTYKEFQQGLLILGYDLGPAGADGIPGRMSQAATIQFKVAAGLSATPVVGPLTLAAMERELKKRGLVGMRPRTMHPIWHLEAERHLNVKEVVGRGSNPTIMGWAQRLGRALGMPYDDDDIPWCGLFVAHCISFTLPNEPLPRLPLRALSWQSFGRKVETPSIGAVLVFTRRGGGHVGFYAGESADAYLVLGGNQSNRVSRAWLAKKDLVDIRWPTTGGQQTGGRVAVDRNGTITTQLS